MSNPQTDDQPIEAEVVDEPTETTPAPEPAKPSTILDRAKRKASGAARDPHEAWVFRIRDEVAELLEGSPFQVDSYLQSAYRVIEDSADLRKAAAESPATVMGGIMLGATLQLQIGGPLGHYYLTPRKNNGKTECVPMIGYRGFFELGYRSGLIRSFDYIVRREGDAFKQGGTSERGKFFEWEQFEGGEFDELDAEGNVRPLTGVVALAHRFGATEPAWVFMSRATIDRRRPSHWKYTPWNGKDAEAMYIKTPHRELAKFQQLSILSARAVSADETISYWNRQTQAIVTLPPDEHAPAELDAAENGPGAGDAGPGEDGSAETPSSPSEPPEAADGRTAPPADSSKVHPSKLPAYARELGRDMTEGEYERFSAWEASQA